MTSISSFKSDKFSKKKSLDGSIFITHWVNFFPLGLRMTFLKDFGKYALSPSALLGSLSEAWARRYQTLTSWFANLFSISTLKNTKACFFESFQVLASVTISSSFCLSESSPAALESSSSWFLSSYLFLASLFI